MPGFDKSGPMGTGAMTGGRRGLCDTTDRADAGGSVPGYGFGRGWCRGRFSVGGAGRGFGRGFGAAGRTGAAPMRTASSSNELEYLTQEAKNLERNLQMIQKRMNELQQKSA